MRNCHFNNPRVPSENFDMRELLKKELLKQDDIQYRGFGNGEQVNYVKQPSTVPIQKQEITVKTDHGFGTTELYFDSVHRNPTSVMENGEILWDITTLNQGLSITQIVGIEIGNFYIPKVNVASTYPDFFYFNKVFIAFLDTVTQQTIRAANGQLFHIECDVVNGTGQAVSLVPVRSTFYFTQPINDLTQLRVKFLVPQTNPLSNLLKVVPLPYETLSVQVALTGGFGYNPLRLTMLNGQTSSTIGLIGALAAPGVAVFIAGLVSNDTTTNNAINDANGVFVTNVIDATTIEIAGIDSSPINAVYTATMFIPKNRIAFPMRFTTLSATPTNMVDVNQRG